MPNNALPKEVEDRYNKASMAVEKKNYDYAIELLIHVLKIKADFAKGRHLLRLAEIKKFDENPLNPVSCFISRLFSFLALPIAVMKEKRGDGHGAIISYEDILRKDPKNTAVLLKLGRVLQTEGMNVAAAATLEYAIKISPKNPDGYEIIGETYLKLGNYEQARFCFKKVLELRPHDANAERKLKNLDALTTIDKSFELKEGDDFRLREIEE